MREAGELLVSGRAPPLSCAPRAHVYPVAVAVRLTAPPTVPHRPRRLPPLFPTAPFIPTTPFPLKHLTPRVLHESSKTAILSPAMSFWATPAIDLGALALDLRALAVDLVRVGQGGRGGRAAVPVRGRGAHGHGEHSEVQRPVRQPLQGGVEQCWSADVSRCAPCASAGGVLRTCRAAAG